MRRCAGLAGGGSCRRGGLAERPLGPPADPPDPARELSRDRHVRDAGPLAGGAQGAVAAAEPLRRVAINVNLSFTAPTRGGSRTARYRPLWPARRRS